MANKSYYTYMKIKAPDPSKESLVTFTRKVNEQLEASTMKMYGNIEQKDLHPNVQKTIESKVDDSTFTTAMSQTSQVIALKADQTTVNTLSGTVTSQGTAITANANAIALKASQTSVDTLGGTVSSMSATLTALPGQITAEIDNNTVHVGATPPSGAGLYAGRLWQNTLTDEQLRWKAIVANSARSYAVMNNTPTVRIDDLSDALEIAVTTAAAATVTLTKTNLLKKAVTVTSNGVTMTVATDGTITLTGTCTAAAGSPVLFPVLMGYYLSGQHTLSAGNTVAYGADLQMRLLQALNTAVASPTTNFSVNSIGAKSTFTLSNQFVYGYAIRVQGGVTYNATLKPQLERAADATTYEAPDHVVYTADASGNAAVIGRDGVNCIVSSALSLSCAYTGSGWALVSGNARKVYASSSFTIDENGATVRHILLDGVTPYEAYTRLYGGGLQVYESDTDELFGGLFVRDGKLFLATSAMADPRVSSDFYANFRTEDVGGVDAFGLAFNKADAMRAELRLIPTSVGSSDYRLEIRSEDDLMIRGVGTVTIYDGSYSGQIKLSTGTVSLDGANIVPTSNGEATCGASSYGFNYFYGTHTSIQSTSDERAKHDMHTLDPDAMLRFIMALDATWYRLNVTPEDLMAGFRAQQFMEAMQAAGIPTDFAGFNGKDPDHLALDYCQVVAPLVSVVQSQQNRIDQLEQRLAALEQKKED